MQFVPRRRTSAKRVLITGANSGFGKAMAMHFGRNGWRVAVTGRRSDAVRAAAEDVRNVGAAEVLEMMIDVSKSDDFEAAARRVEAQWGGLDVLVNNAGIMDSARLHEITLEQWHRIVDINFWGVVYGCHPFVPMLIRQKGGHVSATLRSLDKDQQTGRHTSESVAAHAIRSMERSH